MKNTKTNSLLRLVAFLIITVVFIGVVGVMSSEGAEKVPDNDTQSSPESNIQTPPATDIPAVTIRYENYLSGLFCSKEESERVPICYSMDPDASLYGVANADLTIEFPVEFGQSRLLVYTHKTELSGKIGAIAPLRKYMSYVLSSFGGIIAHNGYDDTVTYQSANVPVPTIDFSKSTSYSYNEGRGLVYTNSALMSGALNNLSLPTIETSNISLPYAFSSTYANLVYGTLQGQNVSIPFGAQNNVRLLYDATKDEYRCEQNGIVRIDALDGEVVYYKNVFVLFCDSATYEKAETTELVLDITSGGQGYYFTNGTMLKFKWEYNDKDGLTFLDLSGQKLIINRGNSYIAFYKSTQISSISIY